MGKLFYGTNLDPITMPDRTLAHLKVVIIAKLRRNESFTLSWTHAEDEPPGRSTLWVHSAIPLRFEYEKAEDERLNQRWLSALMRSAHSTGASC